MLLLPALDLRGGRLARAATDASPRALVDRWHASGVTWVHLVDMDRALGTGTNAALVRSLLEDTRVSWQVGGGLGGDDCTAIIEWGAQRVIAGAASTPSWRALIAQHGPARVGIALDVRAGVVESPPGVPAGDPADIERAAADAGVTTVVYRDLARDGQLGGPALDTVAGLRARGFAVVVAGGIASVRDLEAARTVGAAGVIVGRALLEGHLTIEDALACCG